MICTTVKNGKFCNLMGKDKCTLPGGQCLPVIDRCGNCGNIDDNRYCRIFVLPVKNWLLGSGCHKHTERKIVVEDVKKVNSIKASKRSVKGGKK